MALCDKKKDMNTDKKQQQQTDRTRVRIFFELSSSLLLEYSVNVPKRKPGFMCQVWLYAPEVWLYVPKRKI